MVALVFQDAAHIAFKPPGNTPDGEKAAETKRMRKDVANRFREAVEAINNREEMVNNDDDGDLSGPDFLGSTDDTSFGMVKNLVNLTEEELKETDGTAKKSEIAQVARKAGIRIAYAASPYPGEEMDAAIVITTDKGKVTVPVNVF